jgi:hypothetical protein
MTRLNIRVDSLLVGAERAVGTAVIIDVFRAFTTAAVALANGAAKIIMVRDVEEAYCSVYTAGQSMKRESSDDAGTTAKTMSHRATTDMRLPSDIATGSSRKPPSLSTTVLAKRLTA